MFTSKFKVIHMNSYIISPFFTVFSSHQVAHDINGKVSDKVQNGTLVIHFLILLFSIPLTSSSFFLNEVYCAYFSRSVVSYFATHWTVALQAPLSTGFFRQEYWSGSPFLSPRIFPPQG